MASRAVFEDWVGGLGVALPVLLGVTLILGGGGSAFGLQNLVVQILALALILVLWDRLSFRARSPRALMVLVMATLLLPVVQLIPLPPSIWHALPGREFAVASRELVGAGDQWFPLTLARHSTVTALLSLIGPLAVLLLCLGREESTAVAAMRFLVLLGLANFALGALQVISGGGLALYAAVEEGRLHGFFANHNSSGLFFVITLLAAIGLSSRGRLPRGEKVVLHVCSVLFVLGVLLTNSRSSTSLLLIPFAFAGSLYAPRIMKLPSRTRVLVMSSALLALVVIGGVFAASGRVGATFDRFENLEDSRPQIWEDTLSGADRYWPVGSGIGTFDEVFQIEESLENLIALKAGRAHNDFLETTLESGIFGPLLVLAWVIFIAATWWQQRHSHHRFIGHAAALGLLCVFLQSAVDYPLRNQTFLCVAALLIAVLVAGRGSIEDRVIE